MKPVIDRGDTTHNFYLTTRRLVEQITDGFTVNGATNEVTFENFGDIQQERQSLYFALPPRFRGDQVINVITNRL